MLRFVTEYIRLENGKQSAINAGYSANTAAQIASRLLRRPDIKANLVNLQQRIIEREIVSQDEIVNRFAEIMRMRPDPERLTFGDVRGAAESLAKIKGMYQDTNAGGLQMFQITIQVGDTPDE